MCYCIKPLTCVVHAKTRPDERRLQSRDLILELAFLLLLYYTPPIYTYTPPIYTPLYANLTYPNQSEPLYNKQNGESGQRYCVQVHSWCVGEEDEEVGDDFQPFVSSHLLFSPLFVFDINFSLTIAVAQNGPSNMYNIRATFKRCDKNYPHES